VRVENGALVIEARKEAYEGFDYTSARLSTQGLRSFGNGIVEARVRTPSGSGYWPAFWLLGDNIPQVGWPACGEIDVMENKGSNTVYQYGHWLEDSTGSQGDSGTTSSADITQYHVFSMRRDDSVIEWYIDGVKKHTLNITPSSLSELHQTFFVLLNLAVGGNFTGAPRRTTAFPQSMSVDYVRAYQ
jgi:beta-glucanase (GH16 family)